MSCQTNHGILSALNLIELRPTAGTPGNTDTPRQQLTYRPMWATILLGSFSACLDGIWLYILKRPRSALNEPNLSINPSNDPQYDPYHVRSEPI
ncbi:hypothetical protein ASPVEDRAFT_38689 [Aspergillus versicolor CBS 583.65]|uniref:Uncharacterized protein n=1 Tax=Aspergillus versicolor CBS 583.65 TaxID=1036611 RepID=A0A1L9PCL8_ASPVE|nr:uncharacterized protein ASPVEDRAFT_38689 [Aspergillus versicolor CBS 583.65]OJI99222.1 hypothetical protein ASPVEDRAFT_38689 [Aspergillus versicolor CBS 583.65]